MEGQSLQGGADLSRKARHCKNGLDSPLTETHLLRPHPSDPLGCGVCRELREDRVGREAARGQRLQAQKTKTQSKSDTSESDSKNCPKCCAANIEQERQLRPWLLLRCPALRIGPGRQTTACVHTEASSGCRCQG